MVTPLGLVAVTWALAPARKGRASKPSIVVAIAGIYEKEKVRMGKVATEPVVCDRGIKKRKEEMRSIIYERKSDRIGLGVMFDLNQTTRPTHF